MLEFVRSIVYYPLLNLFTFFNAVIPGHSAAVSIIVLTLLVKLVLIVPSKRAAQAQRKISQLQPLLNELKTEYGEDKQGLAQAQMDLYKTNNINPFGSCLPTILQFVILIALYQVILHSLKGQLTGIYSFTPQASSVNSVFFGVDLLHPDKYFVLPLLAAALQFFLMRLTLPQIPKNTKNEDIDPMVASQRSMIYVLPAVTLFAARSFPAGAALYWVVSTLFGIFQQRQVNKEKFNLTGVDKALKVADQMHPEHKPRPTKVVEEIKEETSTKKGVSLTVRRKK